MLAPLGEGHVSVGSEVPHLNGMGPASLKSFGRVLTPIEFELEGRTAELKVRF